MARKNTKTIETTEVAAAGVLPQIGQDALLAVLIVSLTVNLFILVGWVTLQVTSVYDSQVVAFLFTR